eukprot:1991521-Amphidinium_carterae.1
MTEDAKGAKPEDMEEVKLDDDVDVELQELLAALEDPPDFARNKWQQAEQAEGSDLAPDSGPEAGAE